MLAFYSDKSAPVWRIPISILTSESPKEPKEKFLLDKKEMEYTIENVSEKEFVKVSHAKQAMRLGILRALNRS